MTSDLRSQAINFAKSVEGKGLSKRRVSNLSVPDASKAQVYVEGLIIDIYLVNDPGKTWFVACRDTRFSGGAQKDGYGIWSIIIP